MTYHTHGSVYGVEIPAVLGAFFAFAACQLAYATAVYGYTPRGLAAGYGTTLALAMWWSVYEELS